MPLGIPGRVAELLYIQPRLQADSCSCREDWQYCNENNDEFFAESFVAYIFWNEEMKENMPITYQHIANCLKMMETN